MNNSIVIIGSGIAGLSAATLLAEKGFKVTLLESSSSIGGQAKSTRNNAGFPTEHSLRVYHDSYACYFNLLKKIPFNKKTVFDNLVSCDLNYCTADSKHLTIPALKKNQFKLFRLPYAIKFFLFLIRRGLRWKELKTLLKLDFYNRVSEERLSAKTNMMNIAEVLSLSSSHKVMSDTILSSLTIAAAGKHQTSANIAIELFSECNPLYSFQMMSGPTSEYVFQPWQEYLTKLNVNIQTNANVIDFSIEENTITHCTLSNGTVLTADIFILAPSILQLSDFINKQPLAPFFTDNQKKFLNIEWSKGIQFYFSHLPTMNGEYFKPGAINAFLDSPWKIVSVIQGGDFWPEVDLPAECQYVLSVTFSEVSVAGSLYGKPLLECNSEEIIEEILHQCGLTNKEDLMSYHMPESLLFFTNEFYQANKASLPLHEAYQQKNSSWVINTSPFLGIKPDGETHFFETKTNLRNLYLAGQACKTTKKTPSMEKACESGFNAAIAICKDWLPEKTIQPLFKSYNKKNNSFTRLLDAYLFKFIQLLKY